MPKTIPLDEQIVATLTGICTSEQAAAVLADAENVLRDLTKQADAADVASLSPLASSAEAKRLRTEASDHRFEADRMEASVSALSARIADLKDAEREVREEAQRVATEKKRDELAADIAATYPRIVADLTALVKRIEDAGSIGASAEAIGRGVPANFYIGSSPVMRIGDIIFPMPNSDRLAIDRRIGGTVWYGLETDAAEAA